MIYSRARNADRIEGIEGYIRDPNTVLDVSFEFVRPIIKSKPPELIAA